jgi:hypothetical protein
MFVSGESAIRRRPQRGGGKKIEGALCGSALFLLQVETSHFRSGNSSCMSNSPLLESKVAGRRACPRARTRRQPNATTPKTTNVAPIAISAMLHSGIDSLDPVAGDEVERAAEPTKVTFRMPKARNASPACSASICKTTTLLLAPINAILVLLSSVQNLHSSNCS